MQVPHHPFPPAIFFAARYPDAVRVTPNLRLRIALLMMSSFEPREEQVHCGLGCGGADGCGEDGCSEAGGGRIRPTGAGGGA